MAISGALDFRQTDTVAPCGTIQACADFAPATNAAGRKCTVGGTAGTTAITGIELPATSSISIAMFECFSGQAYVSAGQWTVRLNVTTAATLAGLWTNTHVCVLDSSCASIATLADVAVGGGGVSLTSTGTKSHTFSASARAVDAGETVYVVLTGRNTAGSTQTIGITPDQLIETSMFPGGPYDIQATDFYAAGSAQSDVFIPGPAGGVIVAEAFNAGAAAMEAFSAGAVVAEAFNAGMVIADVDQ